MLTALIMAGGRGTRFWPASTDEYPKQFLNLIGERTMLQETIHRLLPIIDINHIFICTGEKYKNICLQQVPEIPERNIIVEPIGRNTAPCILLSSLYIKQIYGDINVIVLPSDHQINNESEFISVLSDANEFVSDKKDTIITIGIKPDRPETGYGYIKFENTVNSINSHKIKKVSRFEEKPSVTTAQLYLADGHYLWNAGMFMFNVNFMIREFHKYAEDIWEKLTSLPQHHNSDYMEQLNLKYPLCEPISVDYAIMEKTKKLCVIPADFGWDDIGSWNALERYLTQDEQNNILKGKVKHFQSKNNLVFSEDKEIILLDAEDLFLIETNDKIVVGKKESLGKIHELRNK